MGWDASRPVPWRRLTKEFLIYAAIMAVVLIVLFRDDGGIGAMLVGLAVAGPIYLLLGYVLAKFGYQRKTLADLRTPRASTSPPASADAVARHRPPPTKRTSSGPSRPRPKGRRR